MTNPVALALIDLAPLDEPLLECAQAAPNNHVTGAGLWCTGNDEAGIVDTEGGGVHTRAPWVPHLGQLELTIAWDNWPEEWISPATVSLLVIIVVLNDLNVTASDGGLLFTRVGDLWNWWEITEHVAITDGEDTGPTLVITTPLLVLAIWVLEQNVQVKIGTDPATTSWASLLNHGLEILVGGCAILGHAFNWHELARRLETGGDVDEVWPCCNTTDSLPAVRGERIVLCLKHTVDTNLVHVVLAVILGNFWKWSKALVKHVTKCDLDVWEEVLDLGCPFNTNESSTNNEDMSSVWTLLVKRLKLHAFLLDVITTTLPEALIVLWPLTLLTDIVPHRWEPQAFTDLVEETEITSGRDDAIIPTNFFLLGAVETSVLTQTLVAVKALDFTPDEAASHLLLKNWLKHEGKTLKMSWLDEGTKDTRSVLEILLGVNDGHLEVVAHMARDDETGEAGTNNENTTLITHG